jgi:virginiamycin B lyase
VACRGVSLVALLFGALLAPAALAPAAGVIITEYPIPTAAGVLDGIAAGPDGAIWFSESAAGKVGRIAADGAITEFPTLTADSGPSGITPGPDGALWFTEFKANKIGRITTAGVITEYPSSPGTNPYSITGGSDGALWFTAGQGGLIQRITTGGSVTARAPEAGPNAFPNAIAQGPGGDAFDNFYITVDSQDSMGVENGFVAQLNNSNYLVVRQNVPQPTGVVTGPDGASVWFAARGLHAITRLSTAGVTTFPAPGGPWGITTGPDGALWFTEFDGNKIGRITTDGVITDYTIPTAASGPFWITLGSDGALWFTEQQGNKIGRLAITPDEGGTPPTGEPATPPAGAPATTLTGVLITGPNRATVKVDRRGRFTLPETVLCPAGGESCHLTVSASGSVRAGARAKRIVLAKAHTILAAGQSTRVTAKLTGTGLRLLKRSKRLKVRVAINVTANSITKTKTVNLTLKAPARR